MTVRPPVESRPDREGLSPLVWDMQRRVVAAGNHMQAEGCHVPPGAVLEGYDRALHPWMHGRRAADLVERAREVLGL
ncbi:hypothetical protein ACFQL1_01700 [Halomicroarcula sp. GCM10025709]|uniref:hypothetical protein n=1 Tax=Haloarcula TaxID=2237 RepID=UPI0024C22EF3|nr:hypothetical protein [Halomicroarcula sp. YJ-61-S]